MLLQGWVPVLTSSVIFTIHIFQNIYRTCQYSRDENVHIELRRDIENPWRCTLKTSTSANRKLVLLVPELLFGTPLILQVLKTNEAILNE
jgi:hypothetical protein